MFLLMPLLLEKYFTWKLSSTVIALKSLNNGPLLYYMKYYVNVEQKDHLCPRGFQRERRQGANRKEDISHLFGLPN